MKIKKKILNRFCKILLISSFFLFLFIPENASARAGGGGGFRSRSSRSGGFRRGSGRRNSGDAYIIYYIVRLVASYPKVGIPLVFFAFLIFIFATKSGVSSGYDYHVTNTIKKSNIKQAENIKVLNLQKITQKDKIFNMQTFIERVSKGFIKLQEAYSSEKLEKVKPFISDGVYERFNLQLKMMSSLFQHNVVSNIKVLNVLPVAIETDNSFDTIHLKIEAEAIDYIENKKTSKKISGSKSSEAFVEYWSFLRKPGALTLEGKGGLLEGNCPNCGAQIKVLDKTICEYCSAVMNSGEYDWVLSEITQESVWDLNEKNQLPEVLEIQKIDPAFSIQHIEDRVSTMFWRYRAAEFFQDTQYLAKIANPSFILKHKNEFQKRQSADIKYFADCAVGTVELLGLELAKPEENFDSLSVLIKWSGHYEVIKTDDVIKPMLDKSRFYQHIFKLKRATGVQSSPKNLLASSHCPSCGAPETMSSIGKCEYCGISLNDGSKDWILEDVEPYSVSLAHQNYSSSGYAKQKSRVDEEALACAVAVMYADGEIDYREEIELNKFAQSRSISPERMKIIINTVKDSGVELPSKMSKEEGMQLLKIMVHMCLADGKVSREEEEMISKVSQHLGYTKFDTQQLIKKERKEMYLNAKKIS